MTDSNTNEPPTSATRHDLTLTGIPLIFVAAYALATQLPPSKAVLLAAASLLSSALILDALFVHPPQRDHSQ